MDALYGTAPAMAELPALRELNEQARARVRTAQAEARLSAFLDEEALRFFSSLPLGDRLAATHYGLMTSTSPLAITAWQAAHRRDDAHHFVNLGMHRCW
jgi:hypothetical protein